MRKLLVLFAVLAFASPAFASPPVCGNGYYTCVKIYEDNVEQLYECWWTDASCQYADRWLAQKLYNNPCTCIQYPDVWPCEDCFTGNGHKNINELNKVVGAPSGFSGQIHTVVKSPWSEIKKLYR